MDKGPFIETEEGVFLLTDEPDSAGGRMSAHEQSLRFAVDEWLIIEGTSAPVGEPREDKWLPTTDQPPAATLRLKLKNDKRRLHTIRPEGSKPIQAGFELFIRPSSDGSTSGYVRHWPEKDRADPDDRDDEALIGHLAIPGERFAYIIERLKHPGARLKLCVEMPLYKPAIAHSFDRDWYSQDLYLKHDATTPITGYHLNVLLGRLLTDDEQREVDLARLEAEDEARYGSGDFLPAAPVAQATPSTARDARLTWIVALLALLVIAQLIER